MHGKVSEFRKNSSSISYWESSDPIIKKTVVCRDHPTLKKKGQVCLLTKFALFQNEWLVWIICGLQKLSQDHRRVPAKEEKTTENTESECSTVLITAPVYKSYCLLLISLKKRTKRDQRTFVRRAWWRENHFLCCFFLLVCASRVRNSLKEVWHFIIAQNTRFYLEPFKTLLLHFIISANCILIRFMSVFTFWW